MVTNIHLSATLSRGMGMLPSQSNGDYVFPHTLSFCLHTLLWQSASLKMILIVVYNIQGQVICKIVSNILFLINEARKNNYKIIVNWVIIILIVSTIIYTISRLQYNSHYNSSSFWNLKWSPIYESSWVPESFRPLNHETLVQFFWDLKLSQSESVRVPIHIWQKNRGQKDLNSKIVERVK